MLATETIVQVSILGYLFSDLKEAGGRSQETGGRRQETGGRRQETGDRRQETGDRRQEIIFIYSPHTPHPTPHTPHPTPQTPDIPIEMALSALIIPDRATKGKIWETLQYTGSHRKFWV